MNWMLTLRRSLLSIGALFTLTLPAHATTIFYSVSAISGNTYQYDYFVENDSLTSPIDEFTIFFDPARFENLEEAVSPNGWDPLVIQPDLVLPGDGFLDALALTPPSAISPTQGLGGFSIQFDWLGSGTPGSQPFEIRDASSFDLLDVGITVPIPEPEQAS